MQLRVGCITFIDRTLPLGFLATL
eukprot:SAG31_NODE_39031_length_291_cov_1.057292_1_plen_23_part_01